METIHWTPNQWTTQFPSCENFGDFLSAIEKDCALKDKVICRIEVDGQELSESDEEKMRSHTLNGLAEIVVQIDDLLQVITNTVAELKTVIPILKHEALTLSESFRLHHNDCTTKVLALLENFQHVIDSLTYIGSIGEQRKRNWQNSPGWRAAHGRSQATMNELIAAYENRDFLLIADVLEYELSETLESWIQAVNDLSSDLAQKW